MEVPVLCITRQTHKAIRVILAEWPFRIVWLPKSCIRSDWALGDRGIVLEVTGFIAAELEQESWKREMARAHSAASQERQASTDP